MALLKEFILPRLLQWVIVIVVGITMTFLIPRLSPVNPIQEALGRLTQFQSLDPQALVELREQLLANYGLEGNIFEQYIRFWRNLLTGDLGPSFASFPTRVNDLIGRGLPFTVGLLTFTTLLSWALGIFIGTIAGYFPRNIINVIGSVLVVFYPIPYLIIAYILLMIFAYYIPVFPLQSVIRGSPSLDPAWILRVIRSSFLPGISIMIGATAFRFIMARALATAEMASDHVRYANLAGLPDRRIMFSYVARNTMLPQVTDLGLSLGAMFSGALIAEAVFGFPGLGSVLAAAIYQADYNVVMGITLLSIMGIATASLLIDLSYPLLDPRVRYH